MIVTLDFESYYSTDYSLSRMSEAAYILDDRFECIMCAIKLGRGASVVHVGHAAVQAALDAIDWENAALLCHNTRFDGAILRWIFGHTPKLYLDTLSMARALTHSVVGKSSLKAVAEYLGVGAKGDEVVNARGKRLVDFTPPELAAYVGYCRNDNELCRTIFDRFREVFPASELPIVDAVIRMYVEPSVRLNPAKLEAHLEATLAAQARIMAEVAHIDRSVFSSNLKFAALLEERGVEVPMKPSTTPGKLIPALAKNDRAFKEMCEDDSYPLEVQVLFAARLGVKSTIEVTRTAKLLALAQAPWQGRAGAAAAAADDSLDEHWMPVPLRFSGAHTHRFSGDGGFNFQNLKRTSPIRDAIEAPPGWVILHRDSSQIEARGLAMLAGCRKLLDLYERGEDTYCAFASAVYGRKIRKADKLERFVGKTCLAAGTLVVTDRGDVPIEHVRVTDKLWDGVEWVTHEGILANGVRSTVTLSGISLTPDHPVWSGTRMMPASSMTGDGYRLLRLALEAAASSLPDTFSGRRAACVSQSCGVTAGLLNIRSTGATFGSSDQLDATLARNNALSANDGSNTRQSVRTTPTENAFSIGCRLPLDVATNLATLCSSIMVRAVSSSQKRGGGIARRFLNTLRRVPAGMIHGCSLTGSITIADTSPATSVSQPRPRTQATGVGLKTSNSGSVITPPVSSSSNPVYDIVNAGPRHRFMVRAGDSYLITGNCTLGLGYQTGAEKLRHTLFIGNGGISVKVDIEEATRLVRLYRSEYREIPELWSRMETMLRGMVVAAGRAPHGMRLHGDDRPVPGITAGQDALWLPNGLCISYPQLRFEKQVSLDGKLQNKLHYTGPYGEARSIYGGKMTENACQALSRVVIMDVVRRVVAETGQTPFLTTHDSLDYCVPDIEAQWWDDYLAKQFAMRPSWAPDWPLASEGGYGRTLAEAEANAH